MRADLLGDPTRRVTRQTIRAEDEAFFFLDELEQVIREWCGVYHRSRHRGLVVPEFPGLARRRR
jgi:hypothetical protein